jgi:hypothetical protein
MPSWASLSNRRFFQGPHSPKHGRCLERPYGTGDVDGETLASEHYVTDHGAKGYRGSCRDPCREWQLKMPKTLGRSLSISHSAHRCERCDGFGSVFNDNTPSPVGRLYSQIEGARKHGGTNSNSIERSTYQNAKVGRRTSWTNKKRLEIGSTYSVPPASPQ